MQAQRFHVCLDHVQWNFVLIPSFARATCVCFNFDCGFQMLTFSAPLTMLNNIERNKIKSNKQSWYSQSSLDPAVQVRTNNIWYSLLYFLSDIPQIACTPHLAIALTSYWATGKTTFLDDTVKSHKCTYIKQYHNVRPYVKVTSIPNFDPKKLPFWELYEREGTAHAIKVGGTMAGEFTAGLSGGQRKVMLFELICQRAEGQNDLLLVFDEPFAGVTNDFVPYIVERLNHLRKTHNILLVTNDHVEALKDLADNTITVSAIDRSIVQINGNHSVVRDKAILALSVGHSYEHETSSADTKFFLDVEVMSNAGLIGVAIFTVIAFGLFLATFWD